MKKLIDKTQMAALGVLNPIAWIAQRRPLEKAIGLSTIPLYHFQK